MNFKNWLINESSLRDLLGPVPQNPIHHKEGNVFAHTRMVRKSLDLAKFLLEKESNRFPFINIDFYLNEKEEKMLKISAWLHDIGKASSTTINGKHWSLGGSGKIQSDGHDKAEHYLPSIKKIPMAKKILDSLEKEELEDVYFCIDNHMSLHNGIFSKKVMSKILEKNANYKKDRRVKLLLYLIVMDWCGRISSKKGGIRGGMKALKGFKKSAKIYLQKNQET
jgi:CRISPR/Cas system-associated endonuclease Cas3-HD